MEVAKESDLADIKFTTLGTTTAEQTIKIDGVNIDLDKALETWEETLKDVYPIRAIDTQEVVKIEFKAPTIVKPKITTAKPRVIIPVFPGTNCEVETARAIRQAGFHNSILAVDATIAIAVMRKYYVLMRIICHSNHLGSGRCL